MMELPFPLQMHLSLHGYIFYCVLEERKTFLIIESSFIMHLCNVLIAFSLIPCGYIVSMLKNILPSGWREYTFI